MTPLKYWAGSWRLHSTGAGHKTMAAEPNPALSVLKDIHAAPGPEWWPPAPGWWILFALWFGVMLWLGWKTYHYSQRVRLRKATVRELRALSGREPRVMVAGINSLLKRAAIACYGRRRISALSGTAWLSFLSEHTAQDPAPEILASGAYRPSSFDLERDGKDILRWAEDWVKRHV